MFSERIELLDGYIKCNPIFLIVDIILIVHFFVTWYTKYLKTGLKLSYWHFFIFRNFFIQFLLLYPFNSSIKNVVSFGSNIIAAERFIDTAFIVTCLGYVSILFGTWIKQNQQSYILRIGIIVSFERFIETNIKSRFTFYLIVSLAIGLLIFMFSHTLGTKYLFSPRNYFMGNKDARPIYSMLLSVYPIAVVFSGLRVIQLNTTNSKYIFFILLVFSFFLGTRISTIEPITLLFLFYYMKNYKSVSLKNILIVFVSLVGLMLIISSLRSGKNEDALTEILYGNHFSDTRDFAFLLAYFHDQWLLGKSYLAGMMTFIPRQYSDFRENWAFGLYCARLVGIHDPLFPGHRPGYFGEIFMNFSYYGVVILGIWTGIVIQHIDNKIMQEFKNGCNVIKMYSYTFVAFFATTLSISLIFTQFYTFLVAMLFLAFLRHLGSFGQDLYHGKR
jgi:oligosaccharide repeat unit polymerase